MRWAMSWVLIATCACGRVDFDPVGDSGATTPDGTSGGCGGYDFCDRFEAPTISGIWTDPGVVLDPTVAHRGSQSVRITTPNLAVGTTFYLQLGESSTFTNSPDHFWIRAWVRMSALPAAGNRMDVISITEPVALGDFLLIDSVSATLYSQYSGSSIMSPQTLSAATWQCVVLDVSLGANNTIALTGDAGAVMLGPTMTNGTPGVTAIWFGVGFAGPNVNVAQPALDLWIDDVIVHRAAITCAD